MYSINYSSSNFSINELYHPYAEQFNKIFVHVSYPLLTALYFFMTFTILMKSTKAMRIYKYLLIYQVTCCYIWELAFFLCEPMMLWPMKMGYCNGYLSGHDSAKIALPTVLCATVGVLHSNIALFIYRLAATYDHRQFISKIVQPKILFCLVISTFILCEALVLCLILIDPVRVEDMQEAFKDEISALRTIFELHPFTAGYHPSLSNGLIDWLLLIAAVAAYIFPPLLILLCGFYYWRLIYIRKRIAISSYKLHKMLFKALFAQTSTVVIFVFIPFEIITLLIIFQVKEGSLYTSELLVFCNFHLFVDIMSQFYFIKPYRNFLLKIIFKIRRTSVNSTTEQKSEMEAQRATTTNIHKGN
ncbi:hypothetical protein FO519_001843 [Halicephalobus sp. NKZ332]|nr:hypothetical protein FO519_001843 [Halicephalobus sp. NKZ332]